ncbi:MAG: DUF1838 domain-containing protein [Alphaproteobacteria bacterium]|nr:DUF1838 domain-containing protein [Alphaproteobacteria bacterium]
MIAETAIAAFDPLHRRGFLGLAAATAVPGAAAAQTGFDIADPVANLAAYVKIISTFADRPVFNVYMGQVFARIGERLTPLFGYGGYAFTQARRADGGQIELRGKEVAFYLDGKTGEVMETWDNPFTGERVAAVHVINPAFYAKLGPRWPAAGFTGAGENALSALWAVDLATVQSATGISTGAPATVPFLLPWTRAGDRLATQLTMSVQKANPVTPDRWPKASTGPTIASHETFVLSGDVASLSDASAPTVADGGGSLTRQSPWSPFMRMGQSGIVGGLVMSCHLYKVADAAGLPAGLRRYLERRHADMLTHYDVWAPPAGPLITGWTYYAITVAPER